MGRYINVIGDKQLPSDYQGKCEALLESGAKEVNGENFQEDLVCVVDNYVFAAAGYAFDSAEHHVFKADDGRPKRWFIVEGAEFLAE